MGSIPAKKNENFFQKLQNIQIGSGAKSSLKMKKRDLIFILRNLAILIENGLPLAKGLETMVQEKSLKKYKGLLETIKQRVENGDAFSDGLALFPDTFNEIIVSQVRVGEKSGTVPDTLNRIMQQLENSDGLKAKIIKKLAYPVLLVVAGVFDFMWIFSRRSITVNLSSRISPSATSNSRGSPETLSPIIKGPISKLAFSFNLARTQYLPGGIAF